jgi:hypothetical protein
MKKNNYLVRLFSTLFGLFGEKSYKIEKKRSFTPVYRPGFKVEEKTGRYTPPRHSKSVLKRRKKNKVGAQMRAYNFAK